MLSLDGGVASSGRQTDRRRLCLLVDDMALPPRTRGRRVLLLGRTLCSCCVSSGLTGSTCRQCPMSGSGTRGGDRGIRCTHVVGHRPSRSYSRPTSTPAPSARSLPGSLNSNSPSSGSSGSSAALRRTIRQFAQSSPRRRAAAGVVPPIVAVMTTRVPLWRYGPLLVVAAATGAGVAGCSSGSPSASNSSAGVHTTFSGLNGSHRSETP